MDETADTGDIIAQTPPLALPDGITGPQAEQRLAEAAAQLLLDSLRLSTLPRHPHPPTKTYQPYPKAADLLIPTTWPARRAYNFIRGAAEWGPFIIDAAGKLLLVQEALAFDPAGVLAEPSRPQASKAQIQFSPGILEISIWQ
jgi:methionyl-tRNA formyltransferase